MEEIASQFKDSFTEDMAYVLVVDHQRWKKRIRSFGANTHEVKPATHHLLCPDGREAPAAYWASPMRGKAMKSLAPILCNSCPANGTLLPCKLTCLAACP